MRIRRTAAAALALAAMTALPSALASGTKRYADSAISFRYPGSWHIDAQRVPFFLHYESLAQITTGRWRHPCIVHPTGYDCRFRVGRLRRGVLALWEFLAPPPVPGAARPPSGQPVTISGRTAYLQVLRGHLHCARWIEATVPIKGGNTTYVFKACIRGPRLDERQGRVLRMMYSTRLHFDG
jgi:hypothetical protein